MKDQKQYCSIEGDQDGAHSGERCAIAMLAGSGSMHHEDIRRIAASVGERTGWDFSRVRDEREPVPWDYAEVV